MPSLNITISPVDTDARKSLNFKAGDTVKVWQKVKEGDKTRLQAFEGIVLARKHGQEPGATFTVRKIVDGVGVERVFPLFSPEVDKIEIRSHAKKHRRAKLYYVRERAASEIRKKMKAVFATRRSAKPEAEAPEAEPA